jgi:hypothetical protein
MFYKIFFIENNFIKIVKKSQKNTKKSIFFDPSLPAYVQLDRF